MKLLSFLLMVSLSTVALAHPGGGIIALSENSVIVADPVENFIWQVEKGKEPKQLVSKFHGHWLTRGRDGKIYAEAFQEWGGAWSSAAFQLDLQSGKLTEIAHRDDLGVLNFAVDQDGSLIFQRGRSFVSRTGRKESAFRPSSTSPALRNVTAYVWDSNGDLIFADQNHIRRIDNKGDVSLVAEIEGKVLEPKIWNATDTPSIFGLAIDSTGRVLVAMPDLGKVYRIEKNGEKRELAGSDDGWRATGVATFGDSIFLSESSVRASISPRVRIVRSNGTSELLTVPPRSR